jgi:DNA-binding NtrC family response regulator
MKPNSHKESVVKREAGINIPPDLYTTEGWVGQEQVFHLVIRDCPKQFKDALFIFERNFIYTLLRKYAGNVSLCSAVMGISRRTLNRMIDQLDIDVRSLRKLSRIARHPEAGTHANNEVQNTNAV